MRQIKLLLLQLCITGISFSQQTQVEEKLTELLTSQPAVGLSVVVVKNNKIVYTHSFGLQNIEENKPLQNEHLFRIGSISK